MNKNILYTVLLLVLSVFIFTSCSKDKNDSSSRGLKSSSLVRELDIDDYEKLVYNFKKGGAFKSLNKLPVIIDFYAVWCQPCKMMAPVLDELSLKYEGKVLFYKVDSEKYRRLSSLHGVRAYPTLNFIPENASATSVIRETGYKDEKQLISLIEKHFGIQ